MKNIKPIILSVFFGLSTLVPTIGGSQKLSEADIESLKQHVTAINMVRSQMESQTGEKGFVIVEVENSGNIVTNIEGDSLGGVFGEANFPRFTFKNKKRTCILTLGMDFDLLFGSMAEVSCSPALDK